MSVTTVDLRRAAIRYLHYIAGLAVPTAEALVGETMGGIHRQAADAGELPAKKVAASAGILRQILAPIPDDLPGPRDRALLLVGFTGALRRAELASVRIEHLEMREHGIRLALPHSKGERIGRTVTIAIPYGSAGFGPVRSLRRWLEIADIREGAVFRCIWSPPAGRDGSQTLRPRLGINEIDPRTVARIIQKRAAAAGFLLAEFGGHSLKRGAMTTGMDLGVHPTKLKRLGRHKSSAMLVNIWRPATLSTGIPLMAHYDRQGRRLRATGGGRL